MQLLPGTTSEKDLDPWLHSSASDGIQDTFLPNMARRHIDYFNLKEPEKWHVLEGLSFEAGHKTHGKH